jgi:hypothetical protein
MDLAYEVVFVVSHLVRKVQNDLEKDSPSSYDESHKWPKYDFYGLTQHSDVTTQHSLEPPSALYPPSSDQPEVSQSTQSDVTTVAPTSVYAALSSSSDDDSLSTADVSDLVHHSPSQPEVPNTFCSAMLQQWMHFKQPKVPARCSTIQSIPAPPAATRSIITEMVAYLNEKASSLSGDQNDLPEPNSSIGSVHSTQDDEPTNEELNLDQSFEPDSASDQLGSGRSLYKPPTVSKGIRISVGLSKYEAVKPLHPKARFNSIFGTKRGK